MLRRLFNVLVISLLLLGGCKCMNMNDSSARIASKLWALTGPLNVARDAHTATLLPDGRVLVAGGYDGTDVLGGAELFDQKEHSIAKDRFIGTWKLVSFEFRGSDGEAVYPFGKDVVGTIHYDEAGYMSAQLMRSDRALFVSGDQFGGTPEEIKEAFEGYFAYFGRYEVNEAEQTITHRVQGSLFPNWIGQDQVRYFEFSGSRMTLRSTPSQIENNTMTGTFVWERVTGSKNR